MMTPHIIVGNRIPRDYFISTGVGESDIQVHAGSYHLALKDAGIESYNIMTYSSILPGIARQVPKPDVITHGSVLETIMATATATKGGLATAAIIFGWLYDKKSGDRFGGLVCEYNGSVDELAARESLRLSLEELYTNGFDKKYDLQDIESHSTSVVPKKEFGTAIVAIGFVNYIVPILKEQD